MARSRLRGIARFRRLLRRMPDAVRGEILVELRVTGRQILNAVLARSPKRRGNLRRGISAKVLPASLRLQVGILGTKAERANLFYGRIQDLGRREQVVSVRRYRKGTRAADFKQFASSGRKSSGLTSVYLMKVRGMSAKRFITGRYPDLRSTLRQNLRGIFARAAGTIAGGGE